MNADHVQAVKEILTERLTAHLFLKDLVRRTDNAHVRPNRLVAADPGKLSLLQHTEDLALNLERHFADFIQKQRSVIRLLEASDALAVRSGKRSFLMSEKLALEEILRDGCAVDSQKALVVLRLL